MKNLNPPIDIDHKQTFIDIINAKRDELVVKDLTTKKTKVLNRYIDYENNFKSKSLLKISDSTFVEGDKNLLACYLSGGNKIAAIKKSIKDLQDKFGNEKCMYCQIKDPDSFDHFLPKDSYPEFSALALNLIPCCTTCNKKKDKYWKESGETGIINFYLDSMPTKQILFSKISFSTNDYKTPIVSFELSNRNKIDVTVFKIFQNHYERLKLKERYIEKADSEISELKRTLKSFGSKLTHKEEMEATFEYSVQLKVDYGLNYWKAILFETLSKEVLFFTSDKI